MPAEFAESPTEASEELTAPAVCYGQRPAAAVADREVTHGLQRGAGAVDSDRAGRAGALTDSHASGADRSAVCYGQRPAAAGADCELTGGCQSGAGVVDRYRPVTDDDRPAAIYCAVVDNRASDGDISGDGERIADSNRARPVNGDILAYGHGRIFRNIPMYYNGIARTDHHGAFQIGQIDISLAGADVIGCRERRQRRDCLRQGDEHCEGCDQRENFGFQHGDEPPYFCPVKWGRSEVLS